MAHQCASCVSGTEFFFMNESWKQVMIDISNPSLYQKRNLAFTAVLGAGATDIQIRMCAGVTSYDLIYIRSNP